MAHHSQMKDDDETKKAQIQKEWTELLNTVSDGDSDSDKEEPSQTPIWKYGQSAFPVVPVVEAFARRKFDHANLLEELQERSRQSNGQPMMVGFGLDPELSTVANPRTKEKEILFRMPRGGGEISADVASLVVQFQETIGDKSIPFFVDVLPDKSDVSDRYKRALQLAQLTPPKKDYIVKGSEDGFGMHRGACDSGAFREVLAFHGTCPVRVESILSGGFKLGLGSDVDSRPFTFLSPLSGHSQSYSSQPNSMGHRVMIGCKAIVYQGECQFTDMYTIVDPARVKPVCVLYF